MTLTRLLASFKAPRLAAFCVLLLCAAPAFALGTPKWSELSPQRQEALKPLAGEWDKLTDLGKKKWLVVADKYPTMKPDDQKRLQTRMGDWVKLTPEQRRVARENYKSVKAVPTEQKKAEWQQYQQLPETQKKQLAAAGEAKKPVKQKAARRQLANANAAKAAPGKGAAPPKAGTATPPTQQAAAPAAPQPPQTAAQPTEPAAQPVVQGATHPAVQPTVQPAAMASPSDAHVTPAKAP